jgi:hypothetical protein
MLQVDGSPHDWLQGRGPPLCLIGAIDDATSKVMGAFFARPRAPGVTFICSPRSSSAMACPSRSIPVFWTDREPTLQEQLINRKPTTEVGRGLEELGVTLILAHSPQAKGRIERLWNTFQDRLVSELRLAKAKSVQQATVVLERYLPVHNRKFAKLAKAQPAWRKLSALKIERALCFKQQRTVAKDNTVSFEGTVLQLPKTPPFRSHANKRVEVNVMLDGAVEIFYKTEKSPPSIQKQRTQLACIERSARRRGSAMVRFLGWRLNPKCHPDIFTLLLT